MPRSGRTVPSSVVAGATAVQAVLLAVWATRATTTTLTAAVLVFAALTAVVAAALGWRNTFEARLASSLIATYALTTGLLVVTIGLPALAPDRDDPVALISIVGGAVAYVALELDRRARVRRAVRRSARSTYA